VASCLGEWHLQVRYFLPGLVYILVEKGRNARYR
jgi:hypothetical protein